MVNLIQLGNRKPAIKADASLTIIAAVCLATTLDASHRDWRRSFILVVFLFRLCGIRLIKTIGLNILPTNLKAPFNPKL
ncbi:MAG: hypothetical protein HQK60_04085 [Deltaproteobacteria bacterium]|nr:hypothetical protein [Deltaproteobacteria bacterium]